ncbi:hypothetical protein [Yersinia pseudotuberculosis]|nr:hypothetical protein [Yersinia pseudotuberculosis]AYW90849.1 hypothetical protein EGX47_05570 [Yersinia pseudotuberculosis]KGA63373.1 hypothetical protein DJ55_1678 [Yersinia pseudotuberculosis]QES99415.1 hypothetical protein FOB73_14610 [Yersinia pseudotuberculosis]CFU95193.1 Uncharacterised protein [Yersinia pseudotuberculosis]CFV32202.1 Uncharacterised protein [Yersinia pseudotuberculosis]
MLNNDLLEKILTLSQVGIVQTVDLGGYDKETVHYHFLYLCKQGWAIPRENRDDRDDKYGFMLKGITPNGRLRLLERDYQSNTETNQNGVYNITIKAESGGSVAIQTGNDNTQTVTHNTLSESNSLLIWIKRVWGWIKSLRGI